MRHISIARQLTDERLAELLSEDPVVRVELADLAAAPNPASTKRRLYGPMLIEYVRYPDGGINTTILAEG